MTSYKLTSAQVEALAAFLDADTIRKTFAGPGRKLPRRFYELIAAEASAVPPDQWLGKTIAANHGVTESAASRWLTEARRLGLLAR